MPTEKRQKYLAKLANKKVFQRTRDDRQTEYDKFITGFAELGLIVKDHPSLEKFVELADDWLANGTAHQGIFRITALNRDLVYTLTNNKKHEIGVMLKAIGPDTS